MNTTADEAPLSPTEQGSLTEGSLRVLIAQGLVKGWVARGRPGGFCLEAILGEEPSRVVMLGSTRSGPRLFASIATVVTLLRRLGFQQFTVDATGFEPGRIRAARPDRAEAMRSIRVPKPAGKPKKTTEPQ